MIRRLQLVSIFALLLLGLSPAAEEERLGVYSPQTNFAVPVTNHEGREFVSVTDLLDPFGSATLTSNGKHWRLKLETPSGVTVDGEFTEKSAQAKLRGKKTTLASAFWTDGGRGYIPLASAHTVLSQLLGLSANLRENSRRLFLGQSATSYSAELQKGNPSKLVFHFSAPVNPMVSTEPDRVRLNFTRDPIVGNGANPQNLDDPSIHSATFSEGNGSAEILVATSEPLLATFSDNNRTITLTPPPKPALASGPVPVPPSAPSQPITAAPGPVVPSPPRFTVIIDPAHGGDDTGAALADGLFEKDVTLVVARRLRADLEQRGMTAILLRDSDAVVTLDQRATSANASRATVYVSIHAATLGSGVRIYSARLTDAAPSNRHGFLPWNSAQAAYLDQSHNLAASVITELESRKVQGTPLESGLRPLRNVAKPAIAIEIAPPPGAIEGLTSAAYQQSIASGIAAGIANVRNTMEAAR